MATKRISRLNITLSVDASQLERGIQQAIGSMGRVRASMDRTAKSAADISSRFRGVTGAFRNMAAAAVGFVGARAGFRAVADEIERISGLVDRANMLGSTTEVVSELQFAFERLGVSAEKSTAAMGRFVRRIGLAVGGTGAAAKAIEQMGLNAAELAALPLDQRLERVINAIREYGNQAERVALTTQLFGDDARDMILVVDAGVESVDALRDSFRGLGGTLDQQGAERLKAASEAMDDFKRSVDALKQSLVVGLGPALQSMSDTLNGFMAVTRQMGGVWKTVWTSIQIQALKFSKNIAEFFLSPLEAIEMSLMRFVDIAERLNSVLPKMLQMPAGDIAELRQFAETVGNIPATTSDTFARRIAQLQADLNQGVANVPLPGAVPPSQPFGSRTLATGGGFNFGPLGDALGGTFGRFAKLFDSRGNVSPQERSTGLAGAADARSVQARSDAARSVQEFRVNEANIAKEQREAQIELLKRLVRAATESGSDIFDAFSEGLEG